MTADPGQQRQQSAPAAPAADLRRPLLAGVIVLACVAAALLLSLRYASAELDPWIIVPALLIAQPFAFLALWFPGLRLARLAGPPATNAASFWANSLSILFSLVTPSRLFEAVKPVALNLQTGLPLVRGFTAVALERLLDVGCLALLAALALAGAAAQYAEGLREAALVLAALLGMGVAFVGAIAAWPAAAGRAAQSLPFAWLRAFAGEMLATLGRAGSWRALLVPAGYSLLTWTASYLTFFVLVGIVGAIPLTPAQLLFVFVAGTLGFIVTVTPGGLGTYEGAIVLALGSFGYPVADALAIAILLRIANVLPAVTASAWFLARGSFGVGDLVARLRRSRDPR
jgi:uncharacterized membrane protein YbhN (UPF0104 family)